MIVQQFRCHTYEHRSLSVRTLRLFKSEKFLAIMEYSKDEVHRITIDSFKIRFRCQNRFDIRYLEALFILTKNQTLTVYLLIWKL